MIVFVHDWGSYFVVEVLWNYCILALPELFPSSVLSSSGAAAKLWCEQLHLGQGSALVGTFPGGDLLACSAAMLSIPTARGREFAASPLNKINQACKSFPGQEK